MEVSGANAVDAWKQAAKLILNGTMLFLNLARGLSS
jgi:hypothetical protein